MEIPTGEIVSVNGNYEQLRRNLSNNIYLLRHYKKMGRKEFARHLECGIQRICGLEKGVFTPTLEGLSRIAKVLETTPGRLLDVNSRGYLEGRFDLLLDHSRSLEYPPGEFFPERVRAFVEGNFF